MGGGRPSSPYHTCVTPWAGYTQHNVCTLHILSHAVPQHIPDHTCRLHRVHTIQCEARVICTLCGIQVTLHETTS